MTPRPGLPERVELSVILPCYGEAAVARRSVAELREVLTDAVRGSWEIIVVDDGGGDFPPGPWPAEDTTLVRLPRNRGKGAAVAAGMRVARGDVRVYTDADLPYDPLLIPVIAEYVRDGFHLVIGDRTLPDSSYHDRPTRLRRALSGLATRFIGTLVTGGFFDTQCGIKGLRGDVADHLFPLLGTRRFAFDVEVIYLALRFNCAVKRIPVRSRAPSGPSTVRPVRDALRSAVDVLRMKGRASRGDYDCPALERLAASDFRSRLAEVEARASRRSGSDGPRFDARVSRDLAEKFRGPVAGRGRDPERRRAVETGSP